jgi:hypothetical protein
MKKLIALGVTLAAALSLAACGSSSSGGKDTVKESSSAKTTKAKVSSSAKASSSNQEVTNGSPVKVGQWKYYSDFDADGTLVKIKNLNQTVKQGNVTVTIENVKVYSMKPKNDDAKSTAASYFGASGVTDPYYVLQVNWKAANADSRELQTNGLESIVTNTGQQLDTGSGLQDAGTGATVQPSANSEYEADGLLSNSNYKAITKLTVKLGSICTTDTFEDVAPETTISLNL